MKPGRGYILVATAFLLASACSFYPALTSGHRQPSAKISRIMGIESELDKDLTLRDLTKKNYQKSEALRNELNTFSKVELRDARDYKIELFARTGLNVAGAGFLYGSLVLGGMGINDLRNDARARRTGETI